MKKLRLQSPRLSRKVSATSKTKFNESHLTMLTNVCTFATSGTNLATTQSVPALYTSIQNIQSNLSTVQVVKGLARLPITGYAGQKEEYKAALSLLMANGMQAVYAYAMVNDNQVLADQMLFAPSTLLKMTYPSLLQLTGAVITTVTPLAASGVLTSYNVTPASVAAWQTIWNQLNVSFSDPKNAIAARVALTKSVNDLLHSSMVTLTNQTDTLVRQITDADYQASYYSNRKLNEHHMSTQGRFYVLDYEGAPVTGEVFILGTDRSAALDSNGYAMIDKIPFGSHSVSITTPLGTKNGGPYDFKKGKSLTLHFTVGAPVEITATRVISEDLTENDTVTKK